MNSWRGFRHETLGAFGAVLDWTVRVLIVLVVVGLIFWKDPYPWSWPTMPVWDMTTILVVVVFLLVAVVGITAIAFADLIHRTNGVRIRFFD